MKIDRILLALTEARAGKYMFELTLDRRLRNRCQAVLTAVNGRARH